MNLFPSHSCTKSMHDGPLGMALFFNNHDSWNVGAVEASPAERKLRHTLEDQQNDHRKFLGELSGNPVVDALVKSNPSLYYSADSSPPMLSTPKSGGPQEHSSASYFKQYPFPHEILQNDQQRLLLMSNDLIPGLEDGEDGGPGIFGGDSMLATQPHNAVQDFAGQATHEFVSCDQSILLEMQDPNYSSRNAPPAGGTYNEFPKLIEDLPRSGLDVLCVMSESNSMTLDSTQNSAAGECLFISNNGKPEKYLPGEPCKGGGYCDSIRRSSTKLGQWTAEEDRYLKQLVEEYGERKWSLIAEHLPGRIGKQCRERWQNHLRPDIKRESWTVQEEELLIHLHRHFGSKWAAIAKHIPGRTENNIKNVWNATKRRKDARRKPRKASVSSDMSTPRNPLRDYILHTEAKKQNGRGVLHVEFDREMVHCFETEAGRTEISSEETETMCTKYHRVSSEGILHKMAGLAVNDIEQMLKELSKTENVGMQQEVQAHFQSSNDANTWSYGSQTRSPDREGRCNKRACYMISSNDVASVRASNIATLPWEVKTTEDTKSLQQQPFDHYVSAAPFSSQSSKLGESESGHSSSDHSLYLCNTYPAVIFEESYRHKLQEEPVLCQQDATKMIPTLNVNQACFQLDLLRVATHEAANPETQHEIKDPRDGEIPYIFDLASDQASPSKFWEVESHFSGRPSNVQHDQGHASKAFSMIQDLVQADKEGNLEKWSASEQGMIDIATKQIDTTVNLEKWAISTKKSIRQGAASREVDLFEMLTVSKAG